MEDSVFPVLGIHIHELKLWLEVIVDALNRLYIHRLGVVKSNFLAQFAVFLFQPLGLVVVHKLPFLDLRF